MWDFSISNWVNLLSFALSLFKFMWRWGSCDFCNFACSNLAWVGFWDNLNLRTKFYLSWPLKYGNFNIKTEWESFLSLDGFFSTLVKVLHYHADKTNMLVRECPTASNFHTPHLKYEKVFCNFDFASSATLLNCARTRSDAHIQAQTHVRIMENYFLPYL